MRLAVRGAGGGLEEGRRWRSGEGKFLFGTSGWTLVDVVDGLVSGIGVEVNPLVDASVVGLTHCSAKIVSNISSFSRLLSRRVFMTFWTNVSPCA